MAIALAIAGPCSSIVNAQSIYGRWKLIAAEDIRTDGTVARHPWGTKAVGSIVVERTGCYLQIMNGDVPSFQAAGDAVGPMTAALVSTYIAYTGPCVVNEAEGSVTLTVSAAWRPDYVGTVQKRFFRFDNGRLIFGPVAGSIKVGDQVLTRRLTLERAAP